MYGYHAGYAENSGINSCPECGEEIFSKAVDGTVYCNECKKRFAIIVTEDENDAE